MGVFFDEFMKNQPAAKPAVQPTPAPTSFLGKAKQTYDTSPLFAPERMATAGLGKLSNALSYPSQKVEEGLTGVAKTKPGYEQATNYEDIVNINKQKYQQAATQGGVKGLLGKTVGKVYNAIPTPVSALGLRLVLDPINLLGVGAVRQGIKTVAKATKIPQLASKAVEAVKTSEAVQKATKWAKETPAVYKAIEGTVSPYFRNPEAGKVIEAYKTAIRGKTATLFHQVNEAARGLSPAKAARVGQLLEGGVATKKTEARLVEIANQFRKLAEDVGKEAVEKGLLDPKAYEALKGRYMSHIWNEVSTSSNFLKSSVTPAISGRFFKHRTGTEGYVKEFMAPTFLGLGTEMKDIEATKMIETLAQKFGIKAQESKSATGVVSELLNTLRKEYKAPRAGLGPMTYEQTAAYKESLQPVIKMLEEKLTAMTPEGTRMGTKLTGKVIKKGTEAVEDIQGLGTPSYSYPSVAGVPGKRPVSKVTAQLGKVGEMPGVRTGPELLKEEEFTRKMAEGYKYAPEVLSKSKGGKLAQLKDIALPNEVVDYLNRTLPAGKTGLGQVYDTLMGGWKAGKTILNPAYHVRNLISNQILTELQTGKGLLPTVIDYARSVRKYMGKGDQTYVNEAKNLGLIKNKYFGQAVDEFLTGAFKNQSKFKKLASAPGKFQQFAEDTAKLNVFTEFRKQGKTAEEAMKLAEEAIFSPYRISSQERGLMSKAFPFYSFTRQAAPFVGKKLATHPERFTKYIKAERTMENISGKEAPSEKYMPDWMKGMVRTPSKTKEGNYKYFNPQYIYPWGNFLEGEQPGPLGLGINPVLQEYAAQTTGVDPYFKSEFVRESQPKSEQNKTRLQHLGRTVLPSLLGSIPTKILPAIQGREDYVGRQRNLPDVLAGELAGMKTYPYDVRKGKESYANKIESMKRNLTTETNRILRDQSLTPDERRAKIKIYVDDYKKKIQELVKQ